jgi:hypothetical protein
VIAGDVHYTGWPVGCPTYYNARSSALPTAQFEAGIVPETQVSKMGESQS